MFFQLVDTVVSDNIFNYITIGTVLAIIGTIYKFWEVSKKSTIRETECRLIIGQNKEEIEDLKEDIEKLELKMNTEMKDISRKIAHDKDKIFKKIDEIDVKSQNRFDTLTALIIDLFKK